MYSRLTKTVTVNDRECVTCIYQGTAMCRIHKGIKGCGECEVFAAILNQLYAFENMVAELGQDTDIQK